ncbi:MAG: hypothetical protein RL701_2209, partial [Pseudomonadota bacterium]
FGPSTLIAADLNGNGQTNDTFFATASDREHLQFEGLEIVNQGNFELKTARHWPTD